MLSFPTSCLFVEGPDCSGKTTLIDELHKSTSYRWHIFDRSQVSRNIFSSLFNRDNDLSKLDLQTEMSNLNNRYVFLIPDWSVIEGRYEKRGDPLHDLKSLREVYNAFESVSHKIEKLPNVFAFRRSYNKPESLSENVSSLVHLVERTLLREVSDQVFQFVDASGGESYPLQFTLYDDGRFEEASSDILLYEPEAEYYSGIFNRLHEKITNELSGKNEYNRKETIESRRFVYSDDTCISFIQVAVRDEMMDFNVVIRSTDVRSIFPHDLKFLYYLASTCYERFKDSCRHTRLRFSLNSAHIIQ
jgi:hypothetical protein